MSDLPTDIGLALDDAARQMERAQKEDLRDRFAMAALTGLLASRDVYRGASASQHEAQYAYALADDMMEQRKK